MFPSDVSTETKSAVIQSAVKAILSNFVDLSFPAKSISKKRAKSLDHIHEYGKDVLTMGLLFLEFKDAIREGDGESATLLEVHVPVLSSNRSYELHTGSFQLTLPLLLLTTT